MRRTTQIFFCAFALLILLLQAAPAQEPPPSVLELRQALDKILAKPEFQMGFQGVFIQSAADKSVFYERNADKLFLPASNTKILTSCSALALLGKDFVYRTRVAHGGELSGGVIKGNLYLVGAGDPSLSAADLLALAKQTAQAGVRRVTGALVADVSRFDAQALGEGWSWDDEPFSYAAQVSALNVNANVLDFEAVGGDKAGNPLTFRLSPLSDFARTRNLGVTARSGAQAALSVGRLRGQNVVTVSGSLPRRARLAGAVTVENPSRYAMALFLRYLKQVGVQVGRVAVSQVVSSSRTVVAEHVSKPLSEILRPLNKESNNHYAECVFKTVGARYRGIGSYETAKAVSRDWFREIGLDLEQLRQADGSGLSRMNYVSPHNLVRLLLAMTERSDFVTFYDSLPIAGVDGTLKNRLKGTPAESNCRAKTGTISQVSSLSGYVTSAEGERLVFSILMNNHTASAGLCRQAQDQIVARLAQFRRTPTINEENIEVK